MDVGTFQPQGGLEETVSNLKEQGVEVPADTPSILEDASERSRTAKEATSSITSR